jgi:hypothetical protein
MPRILKAARKKCQVAEANINSRLLSRNFKGQKSMDSCISTLETQ